MKLAYCQSSGYYHYCYLLNNLVGLCNIDLEMVPVGLDISLKTFKIENHSQPFFAYSSFP